MKVIGGTREGDERCWVGVWHADGNRDFAQDLRGECRNRAGRVVPGDAAIQVHGRIF